MILFKYLLHHMVHSIIKLREFKKCIFLFFLNIPIIISKTGIVIIDLSYLKQL